MWVGFFVLGLTLGLQFLFRPETPLAAAMVWIGPLILAIWPSQWIARRALHASLWELIRPGLPAVAATLAALAVTLGVEAVLPQTGAFTTLLLRFSAFSIAYAAIVLAVLGADLREALATTGVTRAPVAQVRDA